MVTLAQRAESVWFRALQPLVTNAQGNAATAKALRAARIGMFAERYLALSYVAGAAGALVMGLAAGFGTAASPALSALRFAPAVIGVGGGVFGFLLVRLGFLAYPRLRATARARRIDAELPSVVTMCYALARGDVAPLSIIRTVSEERRAYGEAAVEFGVIVRNVDWLGLDLVSAMKETSNTTPSATLRAFLEGFVSMLNSGADAKDYFMHQAKAETSSAELALERDLEQASLLAEVYVSGLLVLPLLLMVVISGLAPLASGQASLMPIIVFAMIPLGTLIYVVLVDVLLPPETLTVPRGEDAPFVDFGLAVTSQEAPRLPAPWEASFETKLRREVAFELFRQRIVHAWRSFTARMLARPADALPYGALLGLLVLGAGGAVAWTRGIRGNDLAIVGTGILVAAAIVTTIPVAIFHEIRVRRAHKVEEALPENLSKLAGFNERGIGLLNSFQILGRSATGPLAPDLRALDRDVSWNGSLANALRRLRERVNTLRMTKITILLERATAATANIREVLDISAADANAREHLRKSRRQSMLSYVVIIYVVFAVFLYVLYVVANLFYGPGGLASAASAAGSSSLAQIDARGSQVLFAEAAVIQGICCGLVAGRLGEGYTLSGLKHAALLGTMAYVVFVVGVLS